MQSLIFEYMIEPQDAGKYIPYYAHDYPNPITWWGALTYKDDYSNKKGPGMYSPSKLLGTSISTIAIGFADHFDKKWLVDLYCTNNTLTARLSRCDYAVRGRYLSAFDVYIGTFNFSADLTAALRRIEVDDFAETERDVSGFVSRVQDIILLCPKLGNVIVGLEGVRSKLAQGVKSQLQHTVEARNKGRTLVEDIQLEWSGNSDEWGEAWYNGCEDGWLCKLRVDTWEGYMAERQSKVLDVSAYQ
jgi:hypothetical protein